MLLEVPSLCVKCPFPAKAINDFSTSDKFDERLLVDSNKSGNFIHAVVSPANFLISSFGSLISEWWLLWCLISCVIHVNNTCVICVIHVLLYKFCQSCLLFFAIILQMHSFYYHILQWVVLKCYFKIQHLPTCSRKCLLSLTFLLVFRNWYLQTTTVYVCHYS